MMEEIRHEVAATGFDFPTSVTLDDQGVVHVAESGLAFGGAEPGGRVWRGGRDGDRELLVERLRPPVNGIARWGGQLYLSEGGQPQRSPIDVCFDPAGSLYVVDFGEFEMTEGGVEAQPGTGALFRFDIG